MTKQIFPFIFCFTRELNLYTPLTGFKVWAYRWVEREGKGRVWV